MMLDKNPNYIIYLLRKATKELKNSLRLIYFILSKNHEEVIFV